MAIRELFISIGIIPNDQQFKKVEKRIADLKAGFFLLSAGVAAVGAIIGKSLSEAASSADHLDELSQRTGVGTTALQELAYAAEQSGSSAEALNGAFRPLANQMQAAASGSKTAAAAFAKLGVKIKNADGTLRPLEDVLVDSADGLAAVKGDAERSALAVDVFGRSGSELVPFLKNGSQAIADLRAEAQELGFVMDKGTVKAFADFDDTGKRVKNVALGLSRAFAKGLLPSFQALFERLLAVNKASGETIRMKLENWGRRLGDVFSRVDQIASVLSRTFGVLARGFGSLSTPMKIAIGLVTALAIAFLSPAIAMAMLIAAIVLVLDDIDMFVTGGESVLGHFADWLKDWGKKNGGIFGQLAVDFANLLKSFEGAGWKAVFNEIEAHIKVLSDSFTKLGAIINFVFSPISFKSAKEFQKQMTDIGKDQKTLDYEDRLAALVKKFKDEKGKKQIAAISKAIFGNGGEQIISGLFGMGATPGKAAEGAGKTGNVPMTNTFNTTVVAAPGMSADNVANKVSTQQGVMLQDVLTPAFSQFGGR